MTVSLLIFWDAAGPAETLPAEDAFVPLIRLVSGLPSLTRAMLFQPLPETPGIARDSQPPALGLQIDFDAIAALEGASSRTGALQELEAALPPVLSNRSATQQAFLRRSYLPTYAGSGGCSYVVHYPGPAQDTGAWLDHYQMGHIPLMCRLPGVHEVEMLTRIDWISGLDLPRASHMQRNRVLFADADALREALASPVRDMMRKDTADYPPYEGGMFHYPMKTLIIQPTLA